MLTRVEIAAQSVLPPVGERFVQIVNFVSNTLDAIAEDLDVPTSEVTVVLTDDFIADVRRLDPSGLNQTFSSERVGGVVAAKNLPQTKDHSQVTIVFDSQLWRGEQADAEIQQVTTVAHEFAHPLLIRARYATG